MGNGTLLATFDGNGEIEQLFAPNIDALGSRVGTFRTSVVIPAQGGGTPQVIRIGPESFHIRLALMHGSQVLQADYHHRSGPLRIQRRIGLHPTEPLLLDQWKILDEQAGLLHESIPWMGQTTSAHGSMYHPTLNGLVHHRGRRWLGIMPRGETKFVRVGHLSDHDRSRLWNGERLDVPMGPGELGGFPFGQARTAWDQVVQGPATWGAIAIGPAQELDFIITCAESERHLGRLLELMKHVPAQRYFEMIEGMVARRHAPALPYLERISNPRVRSLCERSIDVLHSLQDGRSGALMAAAEVDPACRLSGGYGYSWPRDGAYLATALGAFGFRERVEHYFKFCAETQDESGAWWQRYLATGHAGPSWGRIQIDEPATVIVAAAQHYRATGDLFWLEKNWPMLDRGLRFLEEFHSGDHPRGMPSHDLWEERMGIHAYSLGAVVAALRAGAFLARELSDRAKQVHYLGAARKMRKLLDDEFLGHSGHEGALRRAYVYNSWNYKENEGYWDEVTDSSLLGLIMPFYLLKKRDKVAHRILELTRNRLWSRPTGGILRYERDHYRGGNPWVLTTLWFAQVELMFGNVQEARESFQWALSKATPLGMLPEQVHKETGQPYWVIPLGWSHAMYLMFVREVLDRGKQDEIWHSL